MSCSLCCYLSICSYSNFTLALQTVPPSIPHPSSSPPALLPALHPPSLLPFLLPCRKLRTSLLSDMNWGHILKQKKQKTKSLARTRTLSVHVSALAAVLLLHGAHVKRVCLISCTEQQGALLETFIRSDSQWTRTKLSSQDTDYCRLIWWWRWCCCCL